MWRKARLSGTEGGLDQLENGEGGRGGEGGGMVVWMEKAQETINSLRNGEIRQLRVKSRNCVLSIS